MKEFEIDGKKYIQQEQSDIDKLPPMSYPKDLLTNPIYNKTLEEDCKKGAITHQMPFPEPSHE